MFLKILGLNKKYNTKHALQQKKHTLQQKHTINCLLYTSDAADE